jgi:hypothetical protein
MRKVILSTSFFTFTPILLLISIIYFFFLSYNSKLHQGLIGRNFNQGIAFAALPSAENVLGDSIISKDARIEIVRQFFAKYKSPLEPFASNIIEEADKHNIDYRFLPAIAMQESNLCQKIIPNTYNCWGFGIYGTKVTSFDNYAEAIETITRTLAKNYVAGGLNTPEAIMKKYTPSSNGSWAHGVGYFMDQLQ